MSARHPTRLLLLLALGALAATTSSFGRLLVVLPAVLLLSGLLSGCGGDGGTAEADAGDPRLVTPVQRIARGFGRVGQRVAVHGFVRVAEGRLWLCPVAPPRDTAHGPLEVRPATPCPRDGVVLRREPGTRFAAMPLAELAAVPDEAIVFDGPIVAAPEGPSTTEEPVVVEVPQASPYFAFGDLFYGHHFSIHMGGEPPHVVGAPLDGPVVRGAPALLEGDAGGPDAPDFGDLEGQTLTPRDEGGGELVVEVDEDPCGGETGDCANDLVLLTLDTVRAEPGRYRIEVPRQSGEMTRIDLELRLDEDVPIPAPRRPRPPTPSTRRRTTVVPLRDR